MYRKSLESTDMEEVKKMPGESQDQFITRVGSLPVVTAALGQLCTFYSRTKESNALLKYTFETAESGAKIALTRAQPVLNKLGKPIENINAIACNQLDKLEKNYPIITKPTEQVLDETLVLYKNTLKPSVDKVVAAKDFSVDKVNGVQNYTKSTIGGARDYGVRAIGGTKDRLVSVKDYSSQKLSGVVEYGSQTVNGALLTPYGQVLVTKVDGVLEVTDQYVDHYLPAEVKPSEEEKTEVDCVEEPHGLTRAVSISNKVRTRMYTRAVRELRRVQLRSKETLEKFSFTVDLIQYAKDQMDGVKGRVVDSGNKVKDVWIEINKTDHDDNDDDEIQKDQTRVEAKTLERQAIATARQLTSSLKGMVGYMATTARALPASFQDKVSQTKLYTDHLYNTFRSTEMKASDIPQVALDQAKTQVTKLQESLNQLADYLLVTGKLDWIMSSGVKAFVDGWRSAQQQLEPAATDAEGEKAGCREDLNQVASEEEVCGNTGAARDESFASMESDFSPDNLSFDDSDLEK